MRYMIHECDIPQISIVTPAYNEAECIEAFYDSLIKILEETSYTYEVIFVDDGSKDETNKICRQICKHPHTKLLTFSRNFGKDAALFAGLKASKGKWVITLDADGQHPVEVIKEMIQAKLDHRVDIINGVKNERLDSFISKINSRIFFIIFKKFTSIDIANQSDFKLLDRKVVNELCSLKESQPFYRALVEWVGFRKMNLVFDVKKRIAGTTKWSMGSLILLALNAVFSFTPKPLYYTAYTGFIGTILSCVFLVVALFLKFNGSALSGWASTIIVISLFSNLILTSIGILGVYLSKIFTESKRRPLYIIRKED